MRARYRRTDGPEDRLLTERCLMPWPNLLPGPDNNYAQIVQTSDHLVIALELFHDTRIVPLDDRPRLDARVRWRQGESRGRWNGDTLVIETMHYAGGYNAPTVKDKEISPKNPLGEDTGVN